VRGYTERMKKTIVIAAMLLGGWGVNARAADYFIGADVSPLTLWRECSWLVVCHGGSYDARSHGLGARAGLWTSRDGKDKSGAEIGHARLGGNSGSKDYLLNPGCLVLCAGATASWSNDAALSWFALMGQAYLGPASGAESVTAKIGLYDARVTSSGTYAAGGPAYVRRVNSAGLMLGAAYARPVVAGLSLTLSADLFFNVKVANPIDSGGTVSQMFMRLAAGLEYGF
jgi:hypothetical protein